MKILKNILIGFGGLFVILIVLVVFLAGSSSDFKEEYEPFTKQFLADFSVSWDRASVIDRMSNSLIEDTSTQDVQNFLHQLQGLGELKSFGEITIENYTTHTDTGEEAIFSISTQFEAGHALWKISVSVIDDAARITGIHLVNFEGEMIEAENVVETSA